MATDKIKNVLIIDDNDTDLLIAKIVIEKSGYQGVVTTKNSGKSALDYLQSIKDNRNAWPEIIFLDINMPVVNGFIFLFEFEKFAGEMAAFCKVVVLTSSDNKSDFERFLGNPLVLDFVSKPISIDSFQKASLKYFE